jgi:hypothetical protein
MAHESGGGLVGGESGSGTHSLLEKELPWTGSLWRKENLSAPASSPLTAFQSGGQRQGSPLKGMGGKVGSGVCLLAWLGFV